ncbi:hypothetical protein [Streptomyces sp. NPDC093260]
MRHVEDELTSQPGCWTRVVADAARGLHPDRPRHFTRSVLLAS